MSLLIKICGLTTLETLDASLAAGADMVGFVHCPPSPRHLSLEAGADLSARAKGWAQRVALTVDADDALLAQVVEVFEPDLLQLHGEESPERVATIRNRFKRPVMKAIGLATKADLAKLALYEPVVDYLLCDAKPPNDAAYPGGHGRPFDWSLLEDFHSTRPVLLSGGLTPANLADALRHTKVQGVDVSSGVEASRGVKDVGLIQDFIKAARAAGD